MVTAHVLAPWHSRSAADVPTTLLRSALATATPPGAGSVPSLAMHIVSALFVENFQLRQAPGPSTRIDLTGAMFSMAAPGPVPLTIAPHLVALIYCPPQDSGQGVFEVVFRRSDDPDTPLTDDDLVARNVSPFTVEPGKFTYRLVRGELEFQDYGQVFAHCRIDRGPWLTVPFTLLRPA